jgi:hypothetical protein
MTDLGSHGKSQALVLTHAVILKIIKLEWDGSN